MTGISYAHFKNPNCHFKCSLTGETTYQVSTKRKLKNTKTKLIAEKRNNASRLFVNNTRKRLIRAKFFFSLEHYLKLDLLEH